MVRAGLVLSSMSWRSFCNRSIGTKTETSSTAGHVVIPSAEAQRNRYSKSKVQTRSPPRLMA